MAYIVMARALTTGYCGARCAEKKNAKPKTDARLARTPARRRTSCGTRLDLVDADARPPMSSEPADSAATWHAPRHARQPLAMRGTVPGRDAASGEDPAVELL